MPTRNVLGTRVQYRSSGPAGILWYLFWIAISLGWLLLGVANYLQERAFLSQAELDTGTITRYELHVRNDGKSEYCSRIEFTSKAGEPVAVQGNDCPNSPDDSKIGQSVQVYYDPKNPDSYEEKTFFTGYDSLIFSLIGAVFFSLFWFIPLVRKRFRSAGSGTPLNNVMRQDAERYHANQQAAEREQKEAEKHQ